MFSAFRLSKIKILLFFFFILIFPFYITSQELVLDDQASLDIENRPEIEETFKDSKDTDEDVEPIDVSGKKIIIEKVDYQITGLTRRYPLQLAVPIDKKKIFEDEKQFLEYLKDIEHKFNNLRTLESASLKYEYILKDDDIALAHITISTKDTWNIIAVPFPKYDSNVGFIAKLKGKDYNFFGSLQILTVDISYMLDNEGKSSGSIGANFSYPFKAGIFNAVYKFDTTLNVEKNKIGFDLNNTIEFCYPTKFVDIYFGYYQGFNLNKSREEKPEKAPKQDKKDLSPQENKYEEEEIDSKNTYDPYFLYTKFFFYTPIKLHKFSYAGTLNYTPYVSFHGNWAFKMLNEREKRGVIGTLSHSLSLSRIDWIGNFRHGFSATLDNSYAYNFFLKDKPRIEVSGTVAGYYSFFERVGIYSQLDAFYVFSKKTTQRAGASLRGILNKRAETDTAITLNIDVPIRITSFDFEEITGVDWTRYVGFEWFISFFLDMALVHDLKNNTYFLPKDGWYSGGIEMLLYPHKMRSIYFRISLGFDLSELRNVKGLNKIGGRAKRDGSSISEIFIGIGLHY